MIAGTIILEDHTITFRDDQEGQTVTYTIADSLTGQLATLTVKAPAFFSALAIAVHIDGMPDYNRDYPDAESVMPVDQALRWIP